MRGLLFGEGRAPIHSAALCPAPALAPTLKEVTGQGLSSSCAPTPLPAGGSLSDETEQKFEHFSGLLNNQLTTQ